MILQNERFKITISIDETYTVDSADNQYYDIILNPGQFRQQDFYKVFAITIEECSKVTKLAAVGSFYSYEMDCAILENDKLVVLQDNAISRIDIHNCSLMQYKKFKCFGANYGIYKVKKGYIVYGEIEITMLNSDFEKMWSFSGADIFVSQTEKQPFEICEDRIKLYDWLDNYYELDFEGHELRKNGYRLKTN